MGRSIEIEVLSLRSAIYFCTRLVAVVSLYACSHIFILSNYISALSHNLCYLKRPSECPCAGNTRLLLVLRYDGGVPIKVIYLMSLPFNKHFLCAALCEVRRQEPGAIKEESLVKEA